jgi:hypothetical protein
MCNWGDLTYDSHLEYLATNESLSAFGLAETLRMANARYFLARGDSLLIVRYYEEAGQIVADNSTTSRIGTNIYIPKAGKAQSVEEVAKLMGF